MWFEIVKRYEYIFRIFSPFRPPHATESITCYWESIAPWEGKLINSLMMEIPAQGRVVRFAPFQNFNFERAYQMITGDSSHQSIRDSYFVQLYDPKAKAAM